MKIFQVGSFKSFATQVGAIILPEKRNIFDYERRYSHFISFYNFYAKNAISANENNNKKIVPEVLQCK